MSVDHACFGERYELGELIGYGGMAEVHRGRDLRLGRGRRDQGAALRPRPRPVVPDPVPPRGAGRGAAEPPVDRRGLRHRRGPSARPAPCRTSSWSSSRAARCATCCAPRAACTPTRAMEIVAEICAALDYSHRAGIVHRDIKPAQRHDHPDRVGQGHGLRHRPGRRRRRRDRHPDRRRDRHRAVPLARAGPRRVRRRPLRRLLDRLPAVRAGHRTPAVRGGFPRRGRLPARARGAAAALDAQPRAPARARLGDDEGAGQEPAEPLPERGRDGRRPLADPRRPAGPRRDRAHRRGAHPVHRAAGTSSPAAGRRRIGFDDGASDDDRSSRRGAVIWASVVAALLVVIVGVAYLVLRNSDDTPEQATVPLVVGKTAAPGRDALRDRRLPVPPRTRP